MLCIWQVPQQIILLFCHLQQRHARQLLWNHCKKVSSVKYILNIQLKHCTLNDGGRTDSIIRAKVLGMCNIEL